MGKTKKTASGHVLSEQEDQRAAIAIHAQIIASGGYPKSTQLIQQMLRKPDHPYHIFDVSEEMLKIILKKGNCESALCGLGFEIEKRKLMGLRGIAD